MHHWYQYVMAFFLVINFLDGLFGKPTEYSSIREYRNITIVNVIASFLLLMAGNYFN